jgi:adenylate cyclase
LMYAKSGRVGDARKIISEIRDLAQNASVPSWCFAAIYDELGEIDEGFAWIEQAIDERQGSILLLHIDPVYDPLRSHPRYHTLLRKMNLEACHHWPYR